MQSMIAHIQRNTHMKTYTSLKSLLCAHTHSPGHRSLRSPLKIQHSQLPSIRTLSHLYWQRSDFIPSGSLGNCYLTSTGSAVISDLMAPLQYAISPLQQRSEFESDGSLAKCYLTSTGSAVISNLMAPCKMLSHLYRQRIDFGTGGSLAIFHVLVQPA